MSRQRRLRKTQVTRPRLVLAVLILLTMPLIAPAAFAARLAFNYPASVETLTPNRHARINEPAYQTLAKAQAQVDKQQREAALKTLEKLINGYAQNPYIVSLALRSATWIMLDAEQTNDAITLAALVVRLNSLDEASITSLQHTLAQLYYHNEQYLKTVETLHLWLKHPKNTQITAEDYYLLALAHYQLADCRQSIDAAKQGLTIEPAAPDAFWQLILNCQLQQENYRDAVKSLTTLLALQPNEISYWTQWVLVQQQLQNTPEVLAALELMAMKGWLQTEPLALLYVHLLVQQGNPAKAATQLAQFMENKVIDKNTKQELYLAQLWAQAGETARALPLFRHLKQSSDLAQADLVLLDQWLAYLKSRQPY